MPPPGVSARPPAQAKKGKRWPWVVVAVALFLIAIISGHSHDSGTSSTPTSNMPATAKDGASMAGVGQDARDGKFAFTVTGMETAKTTGDPSNPYEQATAQGEYVIVTMTVHNIGDRSHRFSPPTRSSSTVPAVNTLLTPALTCGSIRKSKPTSTLVTKSRPRWPSMCQREPSPAASNYTIPLSLAA